jgi:hypothetical protein
MFVYDGIGGEMEVPGSDERGRKWDMTNEKTGFVVSHLRKGRS